MAQPQLQVVNSRSGDGTSTPEGKEASGFVMIVDDRQTARSLLTGLARSIEPGLHVESFADPRAALSRAAAQTPDLVISDYRMPGMDGIEFIRRLRSVPRLEEVPVIVVTVVDNRQLRYQALESGATDFLTRPIDPQECRARCRNLLALRRSQKTVSERARWLEDQVVQATLGLRVREKETLLRLAKAGEYHDQETGNHIIRVAKYARLIAEELRLSAMECDEIESAAPMHDIGKIGIPDLILHKPGPLDAAEMAVMRRHTLIGHQMLSESPSRYLQIGAVIALGHHERYDGSGYPHALAGDAIPLPSRIVAVADVFDALMTKRHYKDAWPLQRALDHIKAEAGRHFDPDCALAFLHREDMLVQIMLEYSDPHHARP